MNRSELKAWAKEKTNGHKLDIWIPLIITGAIGGVLGSIPGLSIVAPFIGYIIGVGFVIYMLNLINGKEFKLDMLWSQFGNSLNIIKVYILEVLFVFLWTLLFIIPGMIKGISYSLVGYLLADEKYKDRPARELLKLSEEMMNGHKMDYFVLNLSFIGWIFVGYITCGIYFIWLMPWIQITNVKFLSDIKNAYEGVSSTESIETESKFCTSCGAKIDADAKFCTSCGKEV